MLKPSDHEIHQVMPTLKHQIARQGAHILKKGLASDQHLAQQCILGIAPLQNRMEEKRQQVEAVAYTPPGISCRDHSYVRDDSPWF